MAPIGYLNLYVVLYKRSQNLYLSSTPKYVPKEFPISCHTAPRKKVFRSTMLHVWTIYIHDSLIFLKEHKITCIPIMPFLDKYSKILGAG